MKQVIRLTESDLHRVINEAVKKVLVNEGWFSSLFGKKKQQPQMPVRKSPMQDVIKIKTKPDGRIADDNDPLDERICVNGTMDGMGDRTYFGKRGSLPWYYQVYPGQGEGYTRKGFIHTVRDRNGGRFSQIQYFAPEWESNRGGGITITLWKNLNHQELQRVGQIVVNYNYGNGIEPLVRQIDSVLIKQ